MGLGLRASPLEWLPDQFLDSSAQYIQCSVHGAMFRIEDGWCVRGPCAGDALMAIPAYLPTSCSVSMLSILPLQYNSSTLRNLATEFAWLSPH